MSKGKILVIRGGAIGDFILTLPVLSALRLQFPETRLEVHGYQHIARLALEGGLADDVRSIEARPLAGFFAQGSDLDDALAEYFASFAVIISYLYDPDDLFKDNIARISRAQFIQGPHRPDENKPLHATRVFLQPLERLAIFDADPLPRLVLPPANGVQSPATGQWLALHPGSGSETKNWPAANWAALLRRLVSETGWKLLLVGGEAEGARFQQLASQIPEGRGKPLHNAPLPVVGRELQSCRAFIGHDSGITHLAAAVGLPGVVLWANTNEAIWRPPSPRVQVLRSQAGIASLAVDEVLRALSGLAAP